MPLPSPKQNVSPYFHLSLKLQLKWSCLFFQNFKFMQMINTGNSKVKFWFSVQTFCKPLMRLMKSLKKLNKRMEKKLKMKLFKMHLKFESKFHSKRSKLTNLKMSQNKTQSNNSRNNTFLLSLKLSTKSLLRKPPKQLLKLGSFTLQKFFIIIQTFLTTTSPSYFQFLTLFELQWLNVTPSRELKRKSLSQEQWQTNTEHMELPWNGILYA